MSRSSNSEVPLKHTYRSSNANGNAETDYRAAFERLKAGKGKRLPPNTRVSQNNVAREAGVDPSALRRSRYPKLIEDIQAYSRELDAHSEPKQCEHDGRQAGVRDECAARPATSNRKKDKVTVDFEAERDRWRSQLVQADAKILALTLELAHRSKPPRSRGSSG